MTRAIALTFPVVCKGLSKLGTKNIARLFWLFAAIAVISLSFLYVYQIVSKTTEEYMLRRGEEQLVRLRSENKDLITKIAKANSLNSLASLVEKDLGFEQVDTISYIEVSNNQIVERGK